MRAYYASRISEHISTTPEGYLVCRAVPIARTGVQEYLRSELGLDGSPGEMVPVMRRPEDVFSSATIASFEGKPVTSDHPHTEVSSQNVRQFMGGVATEIRRGTGEESDKLLADLIIHDEMIVYEIQSGKREISCGYDSTLEEIDGVLYQTCIRGNHVAVVDAGRAGEEVRIIDQKPKSIIRRKATMTFKDKLARFFSMTKDATPEELAEVVADMAESEQPGAQDNAPPEKTADNAQADPLLAAISLLTDNVKGLTDEVAALHSAQDTDPLDAVVEALAEETADEEGSPAPETDSLEDPEVVAELDEDPKAVGDIDPTEDEETPDTPAADRKAVLRHIRTMKPLIAKTKDAAQRKQMTDALVKLGNAALKSKKSKSSQQGGYKKLADAKSAALRRAVQPGIAAEMQSAYDSFNPHKRKGTGK